jgi:septation ring formation regulator EzrA
MQSALAPATEAPPPPKASPAAVLDTALVCIAGAVNEKPDTIDEAKDTIESIEGMLEDARSAVKDLKAAREIEKGKLDEIIVKFDEIFFTAESVDSSADADVLEEKLGEIKRFLGEARSLAD